MADTKITDLAAIAVAPANGDLFVLVDVDDTSMSPDGTDKYILWSTIVAGIDVAGAITTHAGASDPHGDRAFATAAIATHEADTTSVHGIADTSTLYRAGGTDVAVADGGTGASDATTARTNLGLGTGDSPTFAGVTARTHIATATAATDKLFAGTMHASQSVDVIDIQTSGGSNRLSLSSTGVLTAFNDIVSSAGGISGLGGSCTINSAGAFYINSRLRVFSDSPNASNGRANFRNANDDAYADVRCRVNVNPFVSPAQITGDTNNYAPTRGGKYRLTSDASRNITGFSISQLDGDEVRIYNAGSNNIVLKNADTNSTDVNRFANTTGADITLAANEGALLDYDGTTQRWRTSKL